MSSAQPVGHAAIHGSNPRADLSINRILVSVYNKAGVLEFVQHLLSVNPQLDILSTGGTAASLRQHGVRVRDISEYTESPEMLHGRVKTLHPRVHGALLAVRGNADDERDMKQYGIQPIDMVIVNLYPFEEVVRQENVTLEKAIENIDIGGPSMIRSSAKNHAYVAIVTSPQQYNQIVNECTQQHPSISYATRFKLATQAFTTTAHYDTAISQYLSKQQIKQ